MEISRHSRIGIAALLVAGALWTGIAVSAQETPKATLEGDFYDLDRTHSLLGFTGRHIGYAKVRGRFKDYDVVVYYDEDDIARSSVSVVVRMDSLDTGSEGRDGQLRSANILDVEKYPAMRFHSDRVERAGDAYALVGPLTVRGVTREVRIPFEIIAQKGRDQFGHTRIAFAGGFTIDRNDFDVVYRDSDFWDGIISDEIEIEIDISLRIYNYLDSVFPRWRTDNSIGKLAFDLVKEKGLEPAVRQIESHWQNDRDSFDFRLSQLYRAGMMLYQEGRTGDALGIFRLTAKLFGETAEPGDLSAIHARIGEMQVRLGNAGDAGGSLERALELDPDNLLAAELLRRIRPGYPKLSSARD